MVTYKEFLEKTNAISESDFDEVASLFPSVNIDLLDVQDYDPLYCDKDDLAKFFITAILEDYNYVYVDELSFEDKTLTLEDVYNLEDLKSIKEEFSDWTITNYNELEKCLLEEEEENKKDSEHINKMELISEFIDNIPMEDLKEFVSKYDN